MFSGSFGNSSDWYPSQRSELLHMESLMWQLYALKSSHAIAAHGNIQNPGANHLDSGPVKRSGSWKSIPLVQDTQLRVHRAGEKPIPRLVVAVAALPVRVWLPADAAARTASSFYAQQGGNSLSGSAESLTDGEWERKAPWHPCKLVNVRGTSVLFQCKSKVENKARVNNARLSLFLLFFGSEQPTPPSLGAAAGARPLPPLSPHGTSGERAGLRRLLPLAGKRRPGRGHGPHGIGALLPSGADSPGNLALYLQKHKAFNCMSFWCFWIASLWRWNSNHRQSYRLATDRKK